MVSVARVLAAAITVVQQVFSIRTSVFNGAAQCIADQLSCQRSTDRPTDYLAAEQVKHHGQVNPAIGSRKIDDISYPFAVRGLGREPRSSLFSAGRLEGSAMVVVGVNDFETLLLRPNSRIAVATVLRQADSSSSQFFRRSVILALPPRF